MAKKTEMAEQYLVVQRLERATVTLHYLGISPLVMNRMPAKAKQQLLMPRRSLNKAAREAVLKHDPVAEFRDSVYRCRDERAPAYVHIPNGALKKAMAQAAIDTPGATKAAVGRLVKVVDGTVHVYGRPYLYMDVVRMAGISHTPDIRTRALFKDWALKVTVQYIRTLIREQDVVNLAANAGDITGIGDGRTEKGTFNNGSWELVAADDPRWLEIVKNGGRKVQMQALEKPEACDEDTQELLDWYASEIIHREADRKAPKTPKAPKQPTAVAAVLAARAGNGKGRKGRARRAGDEA